MNKISLALVLGTGLTLGLLTPSANASPSGTTTSNNTGITTLNASTIDASTFNSIFQPYNTAILSPFRFDGSTTDAGLIESQVFKGTGAATGLYAYAYQVAVNPTTDTSGEPIHVDSISYKFNGTSLSTDLTNSGNSAYAYVIKNGQVGGLNLSGTQVPTTLSFQPGQTTGFIRAQYVDPATQTNPLATGGNSATFVLLSKQSPSSINPSVNVGGGAATTTVPVAYAASPGAIEPVPVPEPATVLAWVGMIGAVGLVRRVRKARLAA